MLNSISYSLPGKLENAVQTKFDEWQKEDKIGRLWNKDATLWTGEDEAKWLGWLEVVETELNDLQKYRDFAEDIKSAGFKHVLLMGMGGSSLCRKFWQSLSAKKIFIF